MRVVPTQRRRQTRWARADLVRCLVQLQRLVVVGAAATWRTQARRVALVARVAEVQVPQTQQTPVVRRHLRAKETTVVPEQLRADRTLAAAEEVLAVLAVTVGRAAVAQAVPAHQTTSLAHL